MNGTLRRNLAKISLIFLTCAICSLALEAALLALSPSILCALAAMTLAACLLLRAVLAPATIHSFGQKLAARWQTPATPS